MSLVVPAFNEEQRLETMLVEAIEFLQEEYGAGNKNSAVGNGSAKANGSAKKRNGNARQSNGHSQANGHHETSRGSDSGWEILVVSDGSKDGTIETALRCARRLDAGSVSCIRVVDLKQNRGKGGAVTHGMRHVRGQYAIFADADGASKFGDLGKLVSACRKIEDDEGRGVAVGSRAHLVGSEAVVKVRSCLSNKATTLITPL